ncbi:type IV pilus modification protein PilV [Chitinimonas taiwanensis]|uniref:Type IV pilus assembly protein PilV n=1 Tax=Chitinimonas taiwanensis DSM 18899 TaxID=1121279 RepID=A0A1K2HKA4_9NEIS|nr:type IV pilus modification protein PilV [Chitinimonas taiwanensis]SFZ77198.1 type IV pilus assembly protein PilV [Chitinimonas taiwanensis DSM 18899]
MKRQSGLIMIEVLLSMFLIAIGVLGVASLQAYSIRSSQSAYWRAVAADLANDLAERVRANRSPKLVLTGETGAGSDESGKTVPLAPDYGRLACELSDDDKMECDWMDAYALPAGTAGADIAKADLAEWMDLVRYTLPVGSMGGAIICRSNTTDNPINPDSAPVLDPAAADFTDKTGCLATDAANYATAPYVIKIWWQDIRESRGESVDAGMLLYSTTI